MSALSRELRSDHGQFGRGCPSHGRISHARSRYGGIERGKASGAPPDAGERAERYGRDVDHQAVPGLDARLSQGQGARSGAAFGRVDAVLCNGHVARGAVHEPRPPALARRAGYHARFRGASHEGRTASVHHGRYAVPDPHHCLRAGCAHSAARDRDARGGGAVVPGCRGARRGGCAPPRGASLERPGRGGPPRGGSGSGGQRRARRPGGRGSRRLRRRRGNRRRPGCRGLGGISPPGARSGFAAAAGGSAPGARARDRLRHGLHLALARGGTTRSGYVHCYRR